MIVLSGQNVVSVTPLTIPSEYNVSMFGLDQWFTQSTKYPRPGAAVIPPTVEGELGSVVVPSPSVVGVDDAPGFHVLPEP